MKAQWITHKGKRIIFSDYNNAASQSEMISTLHLYGEMVRKEPGKILALVDMTNSKPGPDFMKETKAQGKELMNKVDKSAAFGVSGLKKLLLKGFNLFSGETMKAFETREEALEYLTSND